ncbi:hypothetical protein C8J57DRAFT_1251782 [Mycena rebaudengoi]|nr:hypothetical protein C8J57DRAFT_1251782 [Mycena rebaudengoi]
MYISSDGRHHVDALINIEHKKRRIRPNILDDIFASWIPVADDGVDDATLEDLDKISGTREHVRYESSDDPMAQWREVKQMFLDETIRHAGLGNATLDPKCGLCDAAVGANRRFFRLSNEPNEQEWRGRFWKTTTLRDLGLVYQIGHEGRPCRTPTEQQRHMVVMDVSGIHRVCYRYCGCEQSYTVNNLRQLLRTAWYPATLMNPETCITFNVLDLFRLLNVVGNLNIRDFVTSLERKTDALQSTGIRWMPRARRSGRGHDPVGIDATQAGEMLVKCWTCPYDQRNIPLDWFLYMLIIAVDANFKLKNVLQANEKHDLPLGPGWGAFVEPTAYTEHLKGYVNEEDISTCIAFAALLQKDTRLTTGLRTSGVGGCVCAQHECVRPNGLGDLQKGERYANMDYIVMSALAGLTLMLLTISYDIACQWKRNFPSRNTNLPPAIQLDVNKTTLQCGLPVWHVTSHEKDCADENSLSFLVGVGKSNGEGVERTWTVLNPASYALKLMGFENRADTMEDLVDAHNFMKNLGQGDALRRKLIVAIAESGPTEAETRLMLKKDEEAEARKGGSPLHGTSATAFLVAGLQLEDAQHRILSEIAGRALITADRASKIQERCLTFFAKLRKFRALQLIYMPGCRTNTDAPLVNAENVKLWLPSDLPEADRERGCLHGIADMEARLREAQASDALKILRSRLHTKRHMIGFRDSNITGQVKATKARTLIDQVGEWVTDIADKYRCARKALTSLKGSNFAPQFKTLKAEHLTLAGETDDHDKDARK